MMKLGVLWMVIETVIQNKCPLKTSRDHANPPNCTCKKSKPVTQVDMLRLHGANMVNTIPEPTH